MIDFSKRIKSSVKSKKINPEDIYNTLDRASITGPLRPIQINVLSKWYKNLRDNKDLVIKLHTGAGKTLIGLLMAMSYINNNEGPAIYVCPNIYLMQQVCTDAEKFGVPYCILQKESGIPNEFIEGKSLLITYVQKVFNGLSIFGTGNRSINVGCIILDDSHACIDSMFGSCTIQIQNHSPAFSSILELIEDDLREQGNGTLQDLINERSNTMMPIPYWSWQSKINEITRIISENTDDKRIKFAWPIIKDQLADCRAFISASKIEISPMCMPIQQYGIFNNAKHRILMSATTQEDTFFIKGLGLSIEAVSKPLIDENYKWSGEKMVLIPDSICKNANGDAILNTIMSTPHNFGIAVLTPSFEKAQKYVGMGAILANNPDTKIGMYQIMQEYREDYKNKTVVFANRYDGIDLPDNTCRILIVDSVPYYDSLSDRYEELCRAESEIIRIKTIQKIEQGLGRSVRGLRDFSVILIVGSDLIKYIRSVENCRLFSPQTQKQIEIGFEIIKLAKEDLTEKNQKAEIQLGENTEKDDLSDVNTEIKLLFDTINQCIVRDEGWKIFYSTNMEDIQPTVQSKAQLYAILQKERLAYEEVIVRNYEAASDIFQDIADLCNEESEKGWYLQEKARLLYRISHIESNKVQITAFKKNNQLLKPKSGIVYNKIKYPIDYSRNQRIIEQLRKYGNYEELSLQLDDILSNMSFGVEAEKAEDAFYKVGQLLGYISQRPDKEIRKGPDVLWCVADGKYILIECKTEVLHTRKVISKYEAGQMEEHCAWFKSEYGKNATVPVLVIPTVTLAEDAYFSNNVGILRKKNLDEFKKEIREFFKEFKGYQFGSIDSDLVNQKLTAHSLHNDSFIEDLVERAKK